MVNIKRISKRKRSGIKRIKRIGALSTFLNKLNIDDFDDEHVYFFRGHSNHEFELVPSIYRDRNLIENEDKIFREIILRCPDDFNDSMTTFQKLVKMQHYSLPTRLLDITENPLIALFFACWDNSEKNSKKDGEVIVFKIPKTEIKYYDDVIVSAISNLSKMDSSFDSSRNLNDLQNEMQKEGHYNPNIKPKYLQSVICVRPKLDNQRIIRQDGAFFLFGIKDNKKDKCAEIPKRFIHTSDDKDKLIIDRLKKKKILKQLAKVGITYSKIFPEIDNVAKDIKEKYLCNVEKLTPKKSKHIVYKWLKKTVSEKITKSNLATIDFVVVDDNKQKIGYKIDYIDKLHPFFFNIGLIHSVLETSDFDKIYRVFIFKNEDAYLKEKERIIKEKDKYEKLGFVIGTIDESCEFKLIEKLE